MGFGMEMEMFVNFDYVGKKELQNHNFEDCWHFARIGEMYLN